MTITYDNTISKTSQVSTIADPINSTNIPYSTIALVPNIQHRHQLEVERIFTNDLNGYPAGALIIKQFLESPLVNIEVKRNLFIIPNTSITYNDASKQISIDDLAAKPYTYVVSGTGYAYSIPVPPIYNGDKVTVRRKTISNIPLVSWTAGTKLTSNQLNLMTTQLLYLQQEVLDRVFSQAILATDSVATTNSNSISEEKLTANSVSTVKIQNQAVTNAKIALGEITYDRINTTTSPWAVDLMNTQQITGSKKFSNLAIIGSFSVYPYPVTPAGQQYVLAYTGDNDGATGGVSLILNNPWNNLPSYILKTDTDQTITGNKTFGSLTTTIIQGNLKITGVSGGTPQINQVLSASDTDGLTKWSPVVTGIYTPEGPNKELQTGGTVVISPASIGALSIEGGTIEGNVYFNAIVELGNSIADDITVNGTLKYKPDTITPNAGLVLMTSTDGTIVCEAPPATGITKIQMGGVDYSTPTVTITADLLGAVDKNSNQTIGGNKTFSDNIVLGSTSSKTVHILSPLRYKPDGGTPPDIGMVLTASTVDGDILWQPLDTSGFVTSINGSVGSVVDLTIPTATSIIAAIPTATTGIRGLVRVGGGLKIDGEVLSIDTTGVTLPTATTTTLGAIKIGSGLSINTSGEVSVNGLTTGTVPVTSWKTDGGTARTGDVVAAAHDYTATPNSNTSVTNAVDTITAQNITSTKTFKSNQIITALSDYSVASSGKYGIQLDTTGQINAQRAADVDAIFKGYSAGGATTSYIDGFGNSFFSGTVSSQLGFITTGGVTLGDTVTDSIVLNGTIRIPPGATENYVLTCTKGEVAGATITGSITGYTLTVTAVTGTIKNGMNLSSNPLVGGSNQVSALTRITAGSGTSWTVNKSQTVTSREIIATSAETGTAAWKTVPNAPVTSVNGLTNIVKITTGNIKDEATGLIDTPVVSRENEETITGKKTFSASPTGLIVTNAARFDGNVTLGTNSGNSITLNSYLYAGGGLGNGGLNKVLSCDSNNRIQLDNPLVQSVRGTNTPEFWTGRLGAVVLAAVDVGAASIAELATTNANVTTAQNKADLAYTTATFAQTTANNKLSEVATMQTDSITMIQGKGTTLDPLQVLRAYPCGTAVGGDLAGTYPASVTIGANKITYAKMQQLTDAGLLGARAAGNVVQISLGDGLAFDASSNTLKCTVSSSSVTLSAGTTNARQSWTGYNKFWYDVQFASTINAEGTITGAGIFSTGAITSDLTITAKSGIIVSSAGIDIKKGGLSVKEGISVTTGIVSISDTTGSGSTTGGALTVVGGVGIGKDVYIGGDLTVTGNVGGGIYGKIKTGVQTGITEVGTLVGNSRIDLSRTTGSVPVDRGGTGQTVAMNSFTSTIPTSASITSSTPHGFIWFVY